MKLSRASFARELLYSLCCLGTLAITTTVFGQSSGINNLVQGETLEDFFTAAIEFSPRLRIAEENLNIGGFRERQAKGQLLPQVSANATISDNRRDTTDGLQNPLVQEFTGERYSVVLTQALFNWQAWSAKKRASYIENQLEAEYFYELSALLTAVAERYLGVLQAQDAITSINSELDAVTNQLNQIQSLFDLQLAQITDLRQAQASLTATEAELLRLQAELAIAQESLRSVTGIDVGDLFVLDPQVDLPVVENSVQHWVQLARENSHQIEARRNALRAADEYISENKGALYPQVNFIAQRQDTNVGFDNLPLNQADITYFGLDVSIPIYAGGSNRARVSEARAQRSIAESELRQTELEANELVRSAYLQLQSSALLTEAAERLVESTRISSEAMQQGFELGTVNNVDVLNAIRDQFRAERDLQRARYEQVLYYLYLKREAGVLTADDMAEVGSWLIESNN